MREMARGIDTKPYLEWLDGVESVAVSPNTPHGIVAITIAELFNRRGDSFGLAMLEVHLRVSDTPGKRTVLLPDVALYRVEILRALDPVDRLLPNVPPEIIVEVRSPNDRPGFREEKIRRYLAWGCPLVFDVDPPSRTIVVHTKDRARMLVAGDRFSDPAAAWLEFDVREVFERLDLLGF
ncbi:MAG TPA: Uma2 family endonuclease [Candidatus Baltobacteraceae bacterium]|nr:Uma2 family endonuclease [Candidatus Baltobacteraceae bacterium]